MMRKIITILLTLLILFPPITIITSGQNDQNDKNSGLRDSPWPTPQHDVRRTGKSPYGKDGCTGMLKWKVHIDPYGAKSSPVIDMDGTIYVGASENLYAINPDGTIKWKANISDWGKGLAIGKDGTVYVVMWDGKLCAISPNGDKKWEVRIGNYAFASPVIDEEGIIYVGSTNAIFSAVYPNGTIKWKISLKDEGGGTLGYPSLYRDTVYVNSWHYSTKKVYIFAIYRNNGTLKWKLYLGQSGGAYIGPSIAEDETLYAVSGCSLYAIYPNGTVKWKRYLDNPAGSAPAIDDNGNIYVATYGNDESSWSGSYIYAFDSNGTLLWKHHCYGTWGGLAIDRNGIIYGAGTHGLYAFNPNGTLRWVYKLNGKLWGSPAIGEDGTIYATGGSLYAIEPKDAADLEITGIHLGFGVGGFRIKVKNVGCRPAHNVICGVVMETYSYEWLEDELTRFEFTTTVPEIDVNEEVVVKIKGIFLNPLHYSPAFWDCSFELLYVKAEDANPDMLWEGSDFYPVTVFGPFVWVGGFIFWLLGARGWIEV